MYCRPAFHVGDKALAKNHVRDVRDHKYDVVYHVVQDL